MQEPALGESSVRRVLPSVTPAATAPPSTEAITFPDDPAPPQQVLLTDAAVLQWHRSPGFRAFWGWTTRRCDRIKGKDILEGDYAASSPGIQSWMGLLDAMTSWMDEAPPHPQSNQRFGNLAFRQYIAIVENRLPGIIRDWAGIPPQLPGQLIPLLINSTAFGQGVRLDYGTGHELAFVLGLWCCVVSGFIGGEGEEVEEDELVLRVFPRYLELVTRLQQTYRLEPAGSHGVWGLDDYCFFPYLFGSAQLLDSDTNPSEALSRAADKTSQTPIRDMYTLSLHRITLFKRGAAFSEHSPLLYQLSTFPNWQKPHAGLRKMFMGEVAGKRVVVQGLWVGGWAWGPDVPSGTRAVEHGPMGHAGGGGTGSAQAVQNAQAAPRTVARGDATPAAPWARTKAAGVV